MKNIFVTAFLAVGIVSASGANASRIEQFTNFDYLYSQSGKAIRYHLDNKSNFVFDSTYELMSAYSMRLGFNLDGLQSVNAASGVSAEWFGPDRPSGPLFPYFQSYRYSGGWDINYESSFEIGRDAYPTSFYHATVADGHSGGVFVVSSSAIRVDVLGYGPVDVYAGLFNSEPSVDGVLFLEAPKLVRASAVYGCVEWRNGIDDLIDCPLPSPGAFSPLPIPLPAGFPLIGSGLLLLAGLRLVRRKPAKLKAGS